jgi:hypothetical protein
MKLIALATAGLALALLAGPAETGSKKAWPERSAAREIGHLAWTSSSPATWSLRDHFGCLAQVPAPRRCYRFNIVPRKRQRVWWIIGD